MSWKKILVLTVFLAAYVSSTAALSCKLPPDKLIFHCTDQNKCGNSLETEESSRLNYQNISMISPNQTEDKTGEEDSKPRFVIEKWENQSLPSVAEAVSIDKNPCPGTGRIHFYPKENIQKKELRDTEDCYRTKIVETTNYYQVTREPTTQPWNCVRKEEETLYTGGDISWTGPITLEYLLKQVSKFILLV
jgi:hypothetical protein